MSLMYVFEASNNKIYKTPDAYILSHVTKTIPWGDKLKVYPVYQKDNQEKTEGGYQEIYAMFSHEGSDGSCDDTSWIVSNKINNQNKNQNNKQNNKLWFENTANIAVIDKTEIVSFDFGPEHPKYFLTKEDLGWYIMNVYKLDKHTVHDEYENI